MNPRILRYLRYSRLIFGRVTHRLFGWSPRCIRVIPARRLRIWYEYYVDIATAEKLVRGKAAVVKNPTTIVKQYSRQYARRLIFERDGHRCVYCGRSGLPLTLDHVIPRSKGGLTVPDNLASSCVPCNAAKAAYDLEEFHRIYPEGAVVLT